MTKHFKLIIAISCAAGLFAPLAASASDLYCVGPVVSYQVASFGAVYVKQSGMTYLTQVCSLNNTTDNTQTMADTCAGMLQDIRDSYKNGASIEIDWNATGTCTSMGNLNGVNFLFPVWK